MHKQTLRLTHTNAWKNKPQKRRVDLMQGPPQNSTDLSVSCTSRTKQLGCWIVSLILKPSNTWIYNLNSQRDNEVILNDKNRSWLVGWFFLKNSFMEIKGYIIGKQNLPPSLSQLSPTKIKSKVHIQFITPQYFAFRCFPLSFPLPPLSKRISKLLILQ